MKAETLTGKAKPVGLSLAKFELMGYNIAPRSPHRWVEHSLQSSRTSASLFSARSATTYFARSVDLSSTRCVRSSYSLNNDQRDQPFSRLQPLVQPNGTVVVPIETSVMSAFISSDGGLTWSSTVSISNVQFHADAGGIRSGPLPSAAVDGAGTVWVVWEDCRFRSGCATNDLVYSTSTDGMSWSTVARIPIDETSSAVDHFIPGIGIDPATSGTGAHVALHYYYYSQSNCTVSTCQLLVGFISSANGGSSWNAPVALTGPMLLSWLPNSQNGLMVGDYIATVFTSGVPHGVFAVASAISGSTYAEAIYTGQGLTVSAAGRQLSAARDKPLHKLSDQIEKERPEKGCDSAIAPHEQAKV